MNNTDNEDNNKRSCFELGVCQSRNPPCDGCDCHTRKALWFAPGVIDAGPKRQARAWRASDFIGALGLVAVAYFLAGWLL